MNQNPEDPGRDRPDPERSPRPRQCRTVHEVLKAYLAEARRTLCAERLVIVQSLLGRFDATCGRLTLSEARPYDLLQWVNANPQFQSEWTRRQVFSIVKRALNWAVEMELIGRNPFRSLRSHGTLPQREPMSDGDFQALMRASPPAYRRLLVFLKFTGCRPGEASRMRWADVQFDQAAVVLQEHKTAKKTGKPRVIPLVPTALKLLVWMRYRRQVSTVGLLERLLKSGPKRGAEVAHFMAHYGVSIRAVARARQALGVIREWVEIRPPAEVDAAAALTELVERIHAAHARCVQTRALPDILEVGRLLGEARKHFGRGHWLDWLGRQQFAFSERLAQKYLQAADYLAGSPAAGSEVFAKRLYQLLEEAAQAPHQPAPAGAAAPRMQGFCRYRLPDDYQAPKEVNEEDFVFLTTEGSRLTRNNLSLYMQRTRRRAGVPDHVTLYNLRHRYGFQGAKNGVNLKLLSLAMGHTSVAMTEKYIASSGLSDEVRRAALQITSGPGAYPVVVPAPLPVPVIRPPAVAEIPVLTEHIGKRFGLQRPRPDVPAGMPEVALPTLADLGDPSGQSVEALMRLLMGKPRQTKRPPAKRTSSPVEISPVHEAVYQAVAWAVEREPALSRARDRDVFLFLQAQADCPHKRPPSFPTFSRYLSASRLYHDTRKRILPSSRPSGETPAKGDAA
jgi:integrase